MAKVAVDERGTIDRAPGEEYRARRAIPVWLLVTAAGLSALLAAMLYLMAWTEWRELRMPDNMNIDLAFLNQGFYRTVHGLGVLTSTISMEGRAFILSHLSLSFFTIVPLYAAWPSPLNLMLIAACAVAVFGVTAATVAWRFFGSGLVALVWVGLFALHPSVPWAISDEGFREVYLATGFLSLALLFYLQEKDWLFVTMLALAALSKEDIPLIMPAWGLVAWCQGRDRRLAAALVVSGVAYFLVANAVVLPLMGGAPIGHMQFIALGSPLGGTPGEILDAVQTSPASLLRLALDQSHLAQWAALFGPLLFLPVLGWEYLIIPVYVYLEITMRPAVGIPFRYIFPALPFMFVAAMLGTSRLRDAGVWLFTRAVPGSPARAALVRRWSLAAIMCGLAWSTWHSTSWPKVWEQNNPFDDSLKNKTTLLDTLKTIPPTASVAATLSLSGQSSSRNTLYFLGPDSSFESSLAARPDYLAIDMGDLTATHRRLVPSLLCQGEYGVVYDDRKGVGNHGRVVLALGAGLSDNRTVYQALFSPPYRPCPSSGPEAMTPQLLRQAARGNVRVGPSEVASRDMLLGPVMALSDRRYVQTIQLPDQVFDPGWYRLRLTGEWPWPSAPASYGVGARVMVGGRAVGRVAAAGGRPLVYATAPFFIGRRERLPVAIRTDLTVPPSSAPFWVFHPSSSGCATVADAPSLNPRRSVTVEALVHLDAPPRQSGAEIEAPILDKNNAQGYYLRIAGNRKGQLWVDFNVAGKWALGQAGVDAIAVHRWTAIAATYDGKEARIYINGTRAFQDTSRSPLYQGFISSQGALLVIGCHPEGTTTTIFPGRIAFVGVWHRVLTAQELQQGIGDGEPSTIIPGGFVGGWNFQSVEAGTVPDLSPAGNPVTNARNLARVPAPEIKQPFAAWRARERNLLRSVTVLRAPDARVRETLPSVLGPADMFVEPGTAAGGRFAEIVHLSDHTFAPGSYQLDLAGAWPLPWVPAAYRERLLVHVGGRIVGRTAGNGNEAIRYTTPPFHIARRSTLPIWIEAVASIPAGPQGRVLALRPAHGACAIVPDAPALNPKQLTVEALVYLESMPRHPGAETEAPIVSKNNAPGYYLRLDGDDRGYIWVDLNVAGRWVLGRADVGSVVLHRWTAVAATYDGQEARIYVNGYRAPQDPARNPRYAGPIRSEGVPLVIGCRDPGRPYEVVFPGLIASARVWNRVLTGSEIRRAEAAWPLPRGETTGLAGNWGFGYTPAGGVADLSGSGPAVGSRGRLDRVRAPGTPHPFAAWDALRLNLLRSVTVRVARP